MSSKLPPVRRDPFASSGTEDLDPELQAQLTVRERRKAAQRKAERPKATYDLPLALLDAVESAAAEEDISKSDIVAWALVEFLERRARGEVDLEPHKRPARSLRVECKLELPEKWR